jgi:tetratricopeptide (TPR) repeat protein
MPERQRAQELLNTLVSPAFLDIEYERGDSLTAQQVFDKRAGNCISFANLYITLARHYGLNAGFQLIEKHPQWTLNGTIVSIDVHVNSIIKFTHGGGLIVDIGSSDLQQVRVGSVIDDREALALFYNNLSAEAYNRGRYLDAYKLVAKAIANAPQLELLWSNLGAIYRSNNQWSDAEQAYKQALSINPDSFTATNNLAVLYQKQQRITEAGIYAQQALKLRKKNPYYHFYLAQAANQQQEFLRAREHLLAAIRIKSDEPVFHQLLEQLQSQIEGLAINTSSANQI